MTARIIGLGQPAAGGEAVGIAVVQNLRQRVSPAEAELIEAADPAALVPLLENADVVILVDAVVGGAPGTITCLGPERLPGEAVRTVPSHGIPLERAIELARSLSPDRVAERIVIVGVSVDEPRTYGYWLSPEVAEAVPRAAQAILSILREEECTSPH